MFNTRNRLARALGLMSACALALAVSEAARADRVILEARHSHPGTAERRARFQKFGARRHVRFDRQGRGRDGPTTARFRSARRCSALWIRQAAIRRRGRRAARRVYAVSIAERQDYPLVGRLVALDDK